MVSSRMFWQSLAAILFVACALPAGAQSFEIQCPLHTTLHPNDPTDDPAANPAGGRIKCQQLSGSDGFATMGDGTQTYLFSFGPLSGLADMANGLPGTEPAIIFNTEKDDLAVGDPATSGNLDPVTHRLDPTTFNFNGAVGLSPDPEPALDSSNNPICPNGGGAGSCLTGHVDPRPIMDVGVMNGNIPAPTMAIDEDDEFFLTLTNVGMIMRPDLFEQHTVHFHGYPNASSFYDGVPDASVAINIGGSFTYYYLAPDAGTYLWHCHITPPEHLQMGMVGQLYVRPRQNRLATGANLRDGLLAQQADLRTRSDCTADILCSSPVPPVPATPVLRAANKLYAYNDGDGSTAYDVEYPIQIHGFDPNFHFVGMTFNPEDFAGSKNKYFLLNGRSYPDTISPGPMQTQATDGTEHFSQPLPTIINIPVGGKALLRFSDLETNEFQTLASLGIPMHVIALNARLLRDEEGNNMAYDTNSITLGGGESLDVILDASDPSKYHVGDIYYLYTPNLDHLSN
ncbi:MAG: multicopper oxidase domain-containing protein, partial [Steroidobacteraceae bacterium]